MPDGIVPELIAVAALLLVIGGTFFFAGRKTAAPPKEEAKPEPAPYTTAEPVAIPEPIEVEQAPPAEEVVVERPSLRDRLGKTRKFFSDRLLSAFSDGVDEETWDDVEAALIQADIGVHVATKITEDLKEKAKDQRITGPDEVKALLADELISLFDENQTRALSFATEGPTVWLVVGVNGTGKTTTIGKLARTVTDSGRTVALAAADTFRAAADEQLDIWAQRSGAQLVKHQPGADPGAVAYDAHAFARARGLDVLIVDTAGRLHTKTPLMDELSKIRRVIEKEAKVEETLLVIDATAGQNGLVQAKEFAQAAGVTGVVLSKLDGTAKGGIALAIEDTLGIPIKLIGVGEGIEDIEPFDPKTFIDALLS